MAISTCYHIPALPEPLSVTLPGGVSIEAVDVLAQLQPALTPLMPVFNIIEAVLAVFEVLKVIPTLNPSDITQAIADAAEKIVKLARLIPQLSIPFMVVDIVDVIIAELGKLRDVLVRLQAEIEAIDAAVSRAAALGDPQILLDAITCAEENVQFQLDNELTSMQALQKLFAVVDLFLAILPGGLSMPDLGSLSGVALDEAIEPLDDMVNALTHLRSVIPV